MGPIRVTQGESEILSRRSARNLRHSPDWATCADGEWWLVHSEPDENSADFLRSFERIKRGSRNWAQRNGATRELRRSKSDRKIWVRFTRETR